MTSHITVLGDVAWCPAEAQEDCYHIIILLLQCTKEFSLADVVIVQNTAHIPPFHYEYEQDHVHGREYDYLEKFCFPLFQSSLCGKRN